MALFAILVLMALIVFIGVLGELFFSKTRIPDVLWLVLIGIIIGPVLGLADTAILESFLPLFSAFAIIIILFEGGLHFNLYTIIKNTPKSLLLALASYVLSATATSVVYIMLGVFGFVQGVTLFNAAILGCILGGTSSLVVMPLVSKAKLKKKTESLLSIESAFTDVLAVVIVIALIRIATMPEANPGQALLKGIAASFSIAILFGVISGVIWLYVLRFFERKARNFSHHYMLTFSFLLLLYAFIDFVQGSPALGILSFGLVLGNSREIGKILKLKKQIRLERSVREFNSQISFFVKTFFFALIGLLFPWNALMVVTGSILALALLPVRFIAVKIALFRERISRGEIRLMSVLMPRGLAAAVLAIMPSQAGIAGTESFPGYVFTAIVATIVITTLGFYFSGRKGTRMFK